MNHIAEPARPVDAIAARAIRAGGSISHAPGLDAIFFATRGPGSAIGAATCPPPAQRLDRLSFGAVHQELVRQGVSFR